MKKSIRSSAEDDFEDDETNSRSNEVVDRGTREADDDERRKRDCRGLPWPFVNAMNATNCLDLDEDEFAPRLISSSSRQSTSDEDDYNVILPRRMTKTKSRPRSDRPRKIIHEDYDDFPNDPYHRPQARTYHDYAMMLRRYAPPDGPPGPGGPPPFRGGPTTYQDFITRQYQPPREDHGAGWGWTTTTPGWGWSTTTEKPGWGWDTTTTTTEKNGWGWESTTSTTEKPYGSGGGPEDIRKVQPSNLQSGNSDNQATFGQPSPGVQQMPPAQNRSHAGPPPGNRQSKALEFGQPSIQSGQIPAPPQNYTPHFRDTFLQPGYYGPTTTQQYGSGPETTLNPNNKEHLDNHSSSGVGGNGNNNQDGWGSTPPPDYQNYQNPQIQHPPPTIIPLIRVTNQTIPAPSQGTPKQGDANNGTDIMELYNRLLGLYKLLINDTSGQQQQQSSGPPPQDPRDQPWQVPPQQQPPPWAQNQQGGDFGGGFREDMFPGLSNDPYYYDPYDQPKLLPRPISPVARRRQLRRRKSRRYDDEEDIREPRVSFLIETPPVLHEIGNKEEFLPRRRYAKRKIDDKEFKAIARDNKKDKKKRKGRERWGSSFDYYDDYEVTDPASGRVYKHPDIPPWLRYDNQDYQRPVYGPPPPPESGGGWGTPTPGWGTTTEGWGWQTTTEKPGWGWDHTTTTEKPGWGWDTTTTTTTESNKPEQEPSSTTTSTTTASQTEEGPQPGEQWNGPPDNSDVLRQFQQLQQELLKQLQNQGQQIPPQYQNPQYQQPQFHQDPQQTSQYPGGTQPSFGTHSQPSYISQPIQQPSPTAKEIKQASTGQDGPVIEDIGRHDTIGLDDEGQVSTRIAAARKLFNGEDGDDSIVSTVTSTSVSESVGSTEGPVDSEKNSEVDKLNAAVAAGAKEVEQVSVTKSNSAVALGQSGNVPTKNVNSASSIYAARQQRNSNSQTGEVQEITRGHPSWGNWGGSYSPTYSKVQNTQPYRILKRVDGEGSVPTTLGLIEASLSEGADKALDREKRQQGRSTLFTRVAV